MKQKSNHRMELLAPAGSLAVFETAVEQGADAVYIGAPAINARALSRDFSLAEIAAMIAHARQRGVKVYLAMNSLLKEDEIPLAVESLAAFAALQPAGLIIQDLGIYRLARTYFPELRLHASTLLAAHNSLAVRQFTRMGFSRVVLARELPLTEISRISRQNEVELEVFVHGALCFSYSGLCLFSSFLGGKSGLRGRCVQPCRRRYTWEEKGRSRGRGRVAADPAGYFFSMKDLAAFELLPQLQEAGVTSLKIEGRQRSAHYVGAVVKAYRTVLDAMPEGGPTLAAAMTAARDYLRESMGRKTTTGYFQAAQPAGIIAPHHSGNIGIFLGRLGPTANQGRVRLCLKEAVTIGDRLRLHQEKSGERLSFTLKKLWLGSGQAAPAAGTVPAGTTVLIEVPGAPVKGDSLYKVDSRSRRELESEQLLRLPELIKKQGAVRLDRGRIKTILAELAGRPAPAVKGPPAAAGANERPGPGRPAPAWWLKIDDPRLLSQALPVTPARVVMALSRETLPRYTALNKAMGRDRHKIIWALPPIIHENDLAFYGKAIGRLVADGFKTWQIGHVSQCLFFKDRHRQLELVGDYTLNVLNSLAGQALQDMGLGRLQIGIETDRDNLQKICSRLARLRPAGARTGKSAALQPGLTVYGRPPLFTARLVGAHFQYGRPFTSPRGERFMLRQSGGLTLALPEKPFSLLAMLPELAALGLHYVVLDLCHLKGGKVDIEELGRQLAGRRPARNLGSFNYRGILQ